MNFIENFPLATRNTFHIEAAARFYAEPESEAERAWSFVMPVLACNAMPKTASTIILRQAAVNLGMALSCSAWRGTGTGWKTCR